MYSSQITAVAVVSKQLLYLHALTKSILTQISRVSSEPLLWTMPDLCSKPDNIINAMSNLIEMEVSICLINISWNTNLESYALGGTHGSCAVLRLSSIASNHISVTGLMVLMKSGIMGDQDDK